ncbi:hypothetical protein COT72_03305 [archaeon CG10_big_fil_rev_8_21_14_0_10_43_11]|nr:MAG: hypothetical protein COT72_03305 [archaeon CG10_big_fil_rev_8_21_14_0_10_43_11]
MNKRGVDTIVAILIAIIIVAVSLPFLAPIISVTVGTAATVSEQANFATFTLKLPHACSSDASTSIPGLEMSENWHIFQFADFDKSQTNFTSSNKNTQEAFANISALEEDCTDSTCLCLVYVGSCITRDCNTIEGSCKNQCRTEESYRQDECDVNSIACRGSTEIQLVESIAREGACDSGVCCTQGGTRLYQTIFSQGVLAYKPALSQYVYTSEQSRRNAILNNLHDYSAIALASSANPLDQIKSFTKTFLENYECKDQYSIVACESLKNRGACTNETLLTEKSNRAILAFPLTAQKFDRISISRDAEVLRIDNVEVFVRT